MIKGNVVIDLSALGIYKSILTRDGKNYFDYLSYDFSIEEPGKYAKQIQRLCALLNSIKVSGNLKAAVALNRARDTLSQFALISPDEFPDHVAWFNREFQCLKIQLK